jgi:hypothetical protein
MTSAQVSVRTGELSPSSQPTAADTLPVSRDSRRRWKQTVNTLIASQRLAKGGLAARSRANTLAVEEPDEAANRSSTDTFRTAEDDSDEAEERLREPSGPVPEEQPQRTESMLERATRAFGGLKTSA